jgi:nicotinamide mononucleotide transporter
MTTWTAIIDYFAANWLETAGFVTTLVGIWLTTRRLLICWPVVLAADVLYLVVFYRARLFSDALLQVFFVAFTLYGWWHWWRGVREEGEVRVVPLSVTGWIAGLAAGAVGAVLLGWLMVRVGAALPHLDAAHRQLVVVDRRQPGLHRRVSIQRPQADSGALSVVGDSCGNGFD